MKEFLITKNESGKRLDKFVMTVLPKAPSSFVYKMLRKKNIKLNSEKAQGSEKLEEGDRVTLYFSEETLEGFGLKQNEVSTDEYETAFNTLKNITVEYEDEDIVILNKPFNVLSQKADPGDISLNEWLIGYLLDKKAISKADLKTFKPSVLNRLDRNTRGLVIGSKTLSGAREVAKMLKDRTLRKFYLAIVVGVLNDDLDLRGYWYKDTRTNTVTVYDKPGINDEAVPIHTVVHPVKTFEDRTKVEIELVTGKSHQIRAHLSSVGFPLLGDPKYGDVAMNRKYCTHGQMLTASRIVFPTECSLPALKGRTISI